MGYAQGYLLAREIMELIEHFSYRGTSDYLFRMDEVSRRYRFAPRYEQELRGMLDGMRASGQDLYFDELQRDINLLDLNVWNSFLDLTAGCASLAVWGEASVDGQTIDARTFTHGLDEQRYFPRHTLLKTVDPVPPYLSNWLSVSWPGFIGDYSSLN